MVKFVQKLGATGLHLEAVEKVIAAGARSVFNRDKARMRREPVYARASCGLRKR
jgi:hypothetical protein